MPQFRSSALPQAGRRVVELSVAQPTVGVLAVVLDLSDSCGPMPEELRRLPKLLALRSRRTAVWVYSMSATHPLVQQPLNVGHLVDRAVDPERWLDDRRLLADLRNRGSLLRPPLDAIRARCAAEGVTGVTVLVVTDGELLDADPPDLSGIDAVVGLTAEHDPEKAKHWRRVMGTAPLGRLGDAELDAAVRGSASPFYGLCKVELLSNAVTSVHGASRFDPARNALVPLAGNSLAWNFADGPLYLCVDAVPEPVSITCTSDRGSARAQFWSTDVTEPVAQDVLDQFTNAENARGRDATRILLDQTPGQSGFDEAWREAARAADLADRRERWVDAAGRMILFASLTGPGDASRAGEAFLCLCTADPRAAPPANARVIVLGVRRSDHPALSWRPDARPGFIVCAGDIRLDHDPLEGRWMLTRGNETSELHPRGSQPVSLGAQSPAGGDWFALFSGDLG